MHRTYIIRCTIREHTCNTSYLYTYRTFIFISEQRPKDWQTQMRRDMENRYTLDTAQRYVVNRFCWSCKCSFRVRILCLPLGSRHHPQLACFALHRIPKRFGIALRSTIYIMLYGRVRLLTSYYFTSQRQSWFVLYLPLMNTWVLVMVNGNNRYQWRDVDTPDDIVHIGRTWFFLSGSDSSPIAPFTLILSLSVSLLLRGWRSSYTHFILNTEFLSAREDASKENRSVPLSLFTIFSTCERRHRPLIDHRHPRHGNPFESDEIASKATAERQNATCTPDNNRKRSALPEREHVK